MLKAGIVSKTDSKSRQPWLKQLTVVFAKTVVFNIHKELSNVFTRKSAAFLLFDLTNRKKKIAMGHA